MKHKIISPILIIANVIGIICLVYFAIPYCTHDTYVANLDAMLPMEAWDGAGMILTLGLVPMLFANALCFLFTFKKGTPILLRLLFFVPGIVEFIIVVHYWVTSLA